MSQILCTHTKYYKLLAIAVETDLWQAKCSKIQYYCIHLI